MLSEQAEHFIDLRPLNVSTQLVAGSLRVLRLGFLFSLGSDKESIGTLCLN